MPGYCESEITKGEIIIYDLVSEIIYSGKIIPFAIGADKTEIDLSNHPNGIYFIHITSEKEIAVKKIVINK